ncbi:MAG TPA: transcription antitermination factor NusB [Rhabdochlamydiaceae bacterium]|jgi:N utilization substance protein B
MPISLQKFREILFHLLYSADFGGSQESAPLIMQQLAVSKSHVRNAQELMQKIVEKKEEMDSLIRQHSQEYDFERIPRIERTILRLGTYEMLFSATVPPKVAIAEAIRLSRKFSSPESATFVNAILDAIYKTH